MRFGNVLTLGAALICATAASFLARSWMNEQTAVRHVMVAMPQETMPPATSPIVVAARNLEPGEKLSSDMLRTVAWPNDARLNGAFENPALLAQPGQERTVLTAITANEPVMEPKLYKAGQGSLASNLGGSMNAVTIRVNEVAGVAGFVQSGDRVDVFMTAGGKSGEGGTPVAEQPSVVVLLRNVRVLATDQTTERKGQAAPAKAVTLEVGTQDAQKLILASTIGELSLALRRANGGGDIPTRPIAADELITGSIPVTAKPAQVVTVVRGGERQEYVMQSGAVAARKVR